MSANPVGSVGQSWHALQAQTDDHASSQTDLAGSQHQNDAASGDGQTASVSAADHSPAAGNGTASGSGSGQSGSTHIVDHSKASEQGGPQGNGATSNGPANQGGSTHIVDHAKSSDSGNAPGGNSPTNTNTGPRANGQSNGDGNGAQNAGQPQNTAAAGQGSVTLRPQDGQPQPNGASTDSGKLDGKNPGWGDGIGGGQNKGFSGNDGNARIGGGNGSDWGGAHGDGGGLIDGLGNTLNSLLGRGSGYASNDSLGGSNFSFAGSSFTDTYVPPGPSNEAGADDARSGGLLSSAIDSATHTASSVLHDVGQAASSLLDGHGSRIDPSNLSNKSFNDWASTKTDSSNPARTADPVGKNATEEDPPESDMPGAAQGHAAGTDENAPQTGEPAAAFAGAEEEGTATFQPVDKPAAGFENSALDAPEDAAPMLASEQSAPAGVLPGAAESDEAVPLALAAETQPADAANPLQSAAEENGQTLLNPQTRSAQTADGLRSGASGEEARAEAASSRPAPAPRPLDLAANMRSTGFADAGSRQTANEQTRPPPMQNPIYVGEGRQTAPETNPPLVASVERVDAVAANWNIEQNEMNQTEPLDTQQILLRQFTPALVGISALISSAIGGTTMLVSPGGSAAPFLLGVSALLFGMGAWRGSDTVRAQWAQEKSWAQMFNDPAARQSLLATGANGLGLAGSLGLSLLALV